MNEIKTTLENIYEYVLKQQVVTISELMAQFNRSRATIYRILSNMDYITSYNCNNLGIALASVPQFDSWGIWRFKNFYFSKWGTLNETIQNLVDKSPAGLHPKELQDLLGVRIYNHLSMCVAQNNIIRNNDFGHPIYFSTVPETSQRQYRERVEISTRELTSEKPPLNKENVIEVLLAIIKHHVTTVEGLKPILETEGIQISDQAIKWVLKKYDIEKKGA